jgi:hypothetical protein
MDSFDKWQKHKPHVGDMVTYTRDGLSVQRKITRVEDNLCWTEYPDGECLLFIWCFKDTLNILHDWPGKE